MGNQTQLDRYKKLRAYIEEHFKEDINIEKVEAVCHYSYRNINRIFEAIHDETIGKYVKRIRLEKGAQYLKYSEMSVSDIAFEVGFEDRAAFSKAFKKKYEVSPITYRNNSESTLHEIQQSLLAETSRGNKKLQFEIEFLPDFYFLFLEYRGAFDDASSIEKVWDQLSDYALKNNLSSDSIPMTQIIDDNEISDDIHSRYNFGLALERPITFKPEGLFRTKKHKRQKYVKFTYQGSSENSAEFYKEIYAFWILEVDLELLDLPTIEFYPNYTETLPEQELITEIYIPVK